MRVAAVIAQIFFSCSLLVEVGCEPVPPDVELLPDADNAFNELSVYTHYTPAKIDIMPLTEFIRAGDTERAPRLKVYVSLLDSFDCQIKSPGVFRFELYEYVQRSAEPKGRRMVIWPDINLTERKENNNHWQDFLRAYEFNLDFKPQSNQSYILQVTCLCPSGKRLSAEFGLKHTE